MWRRSWNMRLSAQTGKNKLLIFVPVAEELLHATAPAGLLTTCVKYRDLLRGGRGLKGERRNEWKGSNYHLRRLIALSNWPVWDTPKCVCTVLRAAGDKNEFVVQLQHLLTSGGVALQEAAVLSGRLGETFRGTAFQVEKRQDGWNHPVYKLSTASHQLLWDHR